VNAVRLRCKLPARIESTILGPTFPGVRQRRGSSPCRKPGLFALAAETEHSKKQVIA